MSGGAILPRPAKPAVGARGRRLLLWLLLLLLGAVGTFVTVVRVDRVVVGRGLLVAVDERTDVRLSTAGVVAEVYAAEGEQVRAGQLLLRLEDAAERGRLERLRKDHGRAHRQWTTLDETVTALAALLASGEAKAVADVAAAETIEDWRAARDAHTRELRHRETVIPRRVELERARLEAKQAALTAAEATLRRDDKAAERATTLYKKKLIDGETHDAAIAKRDAQRGLVEGAKAALREARQALDVITIEADERVAAAKSRLESAQAALRDAAARTRATRDTARADIEKLEAEIDASERVLELLVLHAPVSGLINFAAPIVPGDRVEADTPAFSISTSPHVAATATFANRDAAALRPGALCKIKLDAYPFERFGVVKARLESVALVPTEDPTTGASVFTGRLAVQRVQGDAPEGLALRAGLTLSAEIVTERPRIVSLLFEPVRRLFGLSGGAAVTPTTPTEAPPPLSPRPAPAARTPFDADRSMADLVALAELGPRPLGSEALENARGYVRAQLEAAGWSVEIEDVAVQTPGGGRVLKNTLASLPGERDERYVLLATHLDTKRLEGVSGFTGANEGASGAAVLIECARVLAAMKPRPAVRIAFFDGKEALGRSGPRHGLYGSRAFVEHVVAAGEVDRLIAVVVCDMVGDERLQFTDDLRSTTSVAASLLDAGARLGYGRYFEIARAHSIPIAVRNDHIPFLRAGIPAALLCDFDFGGADPVRRAGRNRFRHTSEDRVERVSRASLQTTGDVLIEAVRANTPPRNK